MSLPLFPMPRRLAELSGVPPKTQAEVIVSHNPELPQQGYLLTYAETIRMEYADAAGLRYGQQTLDQLRALPLAQQRAVTIEDWPDFPRRAFMLDISRDRVPTRAGLRRLVDLLALARYNQLELYIEHTFAYADHQELWQDASPITAEDLRWLDDLCVGHGIELVPNQNTFGHWERWLALDTYLPRAENAEPQEFAGVLRPPSTLAPTPENAEFVTGLIEELTAHVRSHRINIGADETWELGTGVSRDRAEQEGLGAVFMDYVEQVAEPWTAQGYTVEFWADILGSHPELMDRVPEGSVPVVWLYDAPEHMATALERMSPRERAFNEAHGVETEQLRDFSSRAQSLIEAGVPFWVAPGAGSWLSFTGRLDNAISNILDAARTGISHGSEGFLLTCWGDFGHYDPLVISYAPIIFGGGISWSADSSAALEDSLADILNRHVFDDESEIIGQVLVDVGRVTDVLDAKIPNSSPLFRIIQQVGELEAHHIPSPDSVEEARRILISAAERLAEARPASAEGSIAVEETAQAVRWSLFAADLFISGLLTGGPSDGQDAQREAQRLVDRMDALLADQQRVWLLSSRPGGLETSIGRFAPARRALARLAGGR